MSKWDRKYAAAPEGLFGTEPNEYVRQIEARSDFGARTGLCLADGDGRNSRWLAGHGLSMTAVDLSSVACANGDALDRSAGVGVRRIAADLETWRPAVSDTPDSAGWDAVFLLYLQAPEAIRHAAMRVGWDAVAPGGWFVIEGFAKAQALRDQDQDQDHDHDHDGGQSVGAARGPGAPDLMYDLDEIRAALPGAVIVEAFAGEVRLDEGDRHRGLAQIVRFAARKA